MNIVFLFPHFLPSIIFNFRAPSFYSFKFISFHFYHVTAQGCILLLKLHDEQERKAHKKPNNNFHLLFSSFEQKKRHRLFEYRNSVDSSIVSMLEYTYIYCLLSSDMFLIIEWCYGV